MRRLAAIEGLRYAGHRRVPAALVLGALVLGAGGCSSLHWPWHKAPPPAPARVHVLDVSGPGASAATAQYWKRNTLVVDMSGASGSGNFTLKPPADGWPVRVALRVMPGAVAAIEVHGAQRLVLPISAAGGKPVDLELGPGLYPPKTTQMTVSWGPAGSPAG